MKITFELSDDVLAECARDAVLRSFGRGYDSKATDLVVKAVNDHILSPEFAATCSAAVGAQFDLRLAEVVKSLVDSGLNAHVRKLVSKSIKESVLL